MFIPSARDLAAGGSPLLHPYGTGVVWVDQVENATSFSDVYPVAPVPHIIVESIIAPAAELTGEVIIFGAELVDSAVEVVGAVVGGAADILGALATGVGGLWDFATGWGGVLLLVLGAGLLGLLIYTVGRAAPVVISSLSPVPPLPRA